MGEEHFEHVVHVSWGHCDPARIVYTGHIPWWSLEAINAWWEHMTGDGWYQMELDRGFGLPFVSMSLDFRAPITPRDRLRLRVFPIKLGATAVTFRVEGRQGETFCYEGSFTSVFIDATKFRKAPPPEHIRALVEANLRPAPA